MQIFKNITTDTIFGGTSSRPSLMPMTASWKSFVACGAGFDAVVNTFCWPPYVYDWNACQLPLGRCSLLYFLLLFCCCFGGWIFYECFKNRRIIAGSFRFWRFDSTKSSHKEEFFVVNGFKEQLNLLKRSIFIFELFLEKSSSFLYKNAWKLPLHRAKSFFDIAMSSQVKLITLKVSPATVL